MSRTHLELVCNGACRSMSRLFPYDKHCMMIADRSVFLYCYLVDFIIFNYLLLLSFSRWLYTQVQLSLTSPGKSALVREQGEEGGKLRLRKR